LSLRPRGAVALWSGLGLGGLTVLVGSLAAICRRVPRPVSAGSVLCFIPGSHARGKQSDLEGYATCFQCFYRSASPSAENIEHSRPTHIGRSPCQPSPIGTERHHIASPARFRLAWDKSVAGLTGARPRLLPVARFRARVQFEIHTCGFPVMRRHSWCHVTQNRTAGDGLRFVHGRLDRFFSDGLGACPPHPFLFESYGSEPSIARPFGPRDWR